mmetsp:Transcript_21600/g.30233  ORF Transcript_21600/g.30233 Transcript_21600/m.30233 type:complete len:315 (+) Transcript_21600:377-1321(+)|eukprot:CAMPEP_0184492520 /NCGR_PEP_ID=MMETSP0113_2-20130426/23508_1 /TAXON_ID=91329 /ORGANISM="Norrisiella sphaerica, Strain BC52" /LENGTH=314 /DNA_ID=CAMNT_0026877367 /DNA_START=317 /DNA_END=1261 /DNA_ORIENTATION=+
MIRKNSKYTALGTSQADDLTESVGNLHDTESNSRFKILFLGDEGAGKTAFIQRFLTNDFSEMHSPTVGMDFKSDTLFLGGRITKLKIWDASGHIKFRSLIPQYIRDADVIVLMFSTSSRESFDSLDTWLNTILEVRPTSELLLVLVGTKVDLDSSREVSEKEGTEFAREHKMMFFEVSSKETHVGTQCKDVFHTIAKQLSPGDIGDGKNHRDLIRELDELDDDYFGESENRSFCCKLCCCLGVFCPCLAFLCEQKKEQHTSHLMLREGVDSPENGAGVKNAEITHGELGTASQQAVFMIDPEEELEDLDLDESP